MSVLRKVGIGLLVLVAIGFLAPNGWYVLGGLVVALVVVAYGFWVWLEEHHDSRRPDSRPFRAGRSGDGRWILPDEDKGPRP